MELAGDAEALLPSCAPPRTAGPAQRRPLSAEHAKLAALIGGVSHALSACGVGGAGTAIAVASRGSAGGSAALIARPPTLLAGP
jgi:hypothetical protein